MFEVFKILENGIILKINRSANLINTIDPVISDNCNLKCPHCWGNNDFGISIKTDDFLNILNLANSLNIKNIQFTGGEPLLNKDVIQMAKIGKDLLFNNRLRTNFAIKKFDNDFLLDIVQNFDSIYVSIDGLAETNFTLRPTKQYLKLNDKSLFKSMAKENFDTIITNLKNTIKLKKKYNNTIKIIVCSVIQKYNLNEIYNLINFFNDFELDCLDFTQVSLEDGNENLISKDEFLNTIFDNLKHSKNKIKIKPFSNLRCIICETNGDVMLSGSINKRKLGNYKDINCNISNQINQNITDNYSNYVNYHFIPFNKMV